MSEAIIVSPLKKWMDEQWAKPGVKFAGHGVVYMGTGLKDMQIRGGTQRNPIIDKETKKRRAGLAMYNEKLKPIILAEATSEMRNMEIPPKTYKDDATVEKRPHYTWPKQETAPIETKPTAKKRVTKTKVTQAAAILEKVPADSLPAFLQRFDLPAAIAASIIAAGNTNEMAKLFLQSTINA